MNLFAAETRRILTPESGDLIVMGGRAQRAFGELLAREPPPQPQRSGPQQPATSQ
jgi:alkylated DNA repair dioxygenase AlkB